MAKNRDADRAERREMASRFETATNPARTDAYCTPEDHRIYFKGRCDWCGRKIETGQ